MINITVTEYFLRERTTMPVLNGYLSIVEAAEILGVHPGTVKRLCREGRLVAEKVHNGWLIHNNVLHDFAEEYSGRRGRPQTNNSRSGARKRLVRRF